MSEAAYEAAETEAREFEAGETDQADLDLNAADDGADEGEDGEPKEAKAVDWEKRAHDKEGALAKERSRRRELERRHREVEARLAAVESRAAPGENQEDAIEKLAAALRDDDDDPITDLASLKGIIKTFIAQQRQDREGEQQVTQQQRAIHTLVSTMEEYEADFSSEHADYHKAAGHYKQARREEFEEQGYSGAALQRILAQDLLGLAQRAIEGGRDPAEVVYGLAKKRGFAAGADDKNDKLKKIAEAAEAGRGAGNGKANGGGLTMGAVAGLKGAAFDAAFDKLKAQERRA